MKKRTIGIIFIVVLLLGGIAAAYIIFGLHYQTHFFENAFINGIDVSDLTVEEAERLIAAEAEDYQVEVVTRDGAREIIQGADFDYHFVSDGGTEACLAQQNILLWPLALMGEKTSYTTETLTAWDDTKLQNALQSLDCMQEEHVTPPQDAYVSRKEDGTYGLISEVEGNQLDADKAFALLKETVESGGRSVDFEAGDCYLEPAVRATDGGLQAEAAIRNRYSNITVTYDMGGGATVTLDADTTSSWFSLSEDNQISFDRDAVAAWVGQLADQYDTIGAYLPFVTSMGETVYPESRTYGWQMDREAETEALYQLLMAGDSGERSPVWLESAWTRGSNDLGNTYVEIDYTNQRMWYYKDGVLLVETPVVTGNVSAGNASPEGVFCLVGKEENATLVGEDYKTPVSYWMPFYGGVGIHDADTWRTAYGGTIYQWSGSHGCINTPTAQAAVIFQNIEVGTPIVCYSSGIDYGYGQEGTTGTADAGSDVIIIEDNGSTGGSDGTSSEAGGSDGTSSETGGTGGTDGTVPSENTGSAEFPITIEDEWSDESLYYQDGEIIY